MRSTRLRVLKLVCRLRLTSSYRCSNAFDPIEGTETELSRYRIHSTFCSNAFDPIEGTETCFPPSQGAGL